MLDFRVWLDLPAPRSAAERLSYNPRHLCNQFHKPIMFIFPDILICRNCYNVLIQSSSERCECARSVGNHNGNLLISSRLPEIDKGFFQNDPNCSTCRGRACHCDSLDDCNVCPQRSCVAQTKRSKHGDDTSYFPCNAGLSLPHSPDYPYSRTKDYIAYRNAWYNIQIQLLLTKLPK